MKSNLRYTDENNVYIKSKKMQQLEKIQAYIKKVQSIKNAVQGNLDDIYTIPEGAKVMLNYESITSEPDYKNKVEGYREFVENNKDKVFTVQYDEKYRNKPVLVSLAEDTNKIKWLWHCESDLIVIDEDEDTAIE